MADEPERRVAGAIMLELERQAAENPYGAQVSPPDSMGLIWVDGPIDLHLLARAIINETQIGG